MGLLTGILLSIILFYIIHLCSGYIGCIILMNAIDYHLNTIYKDSSIEYSGYKYWLRPFFGKGTLVADLALLFVFLFCGMLASIIMIPIAVLTCKESLWYSIKYGMFGHNNKLKRII